MDSEDGKRRAVGAPPTINILMRSQEEQVPVSSHDSREEPSPNEVPRLSQFQLEFAVGDLCWFQRGGRIKNYDAGEITDITRNNVAWKWYADGQRCTRSVILVRAQNLRLVNPVELHHLLIDNNYTLEDIQIILQRNLSEALSVGLSPPTYSFQGFKDIENTQKWTELLFKWLPTFNPLEFLSRRINSEAPIGSAKKSWSECVRALTNLMKQVEAVLDDGSYQESEIFNQLHMIARCLPILLL